MDSILLIWKAWCYTDISHVLSVMIRAAQHTWLRGGLLTSAHQSVSSDALQELGDI